MVNLVLLVIESDAKSLLMCDISDWKLSLLSNLSPFSDFLAGSAK